MDKEEFYWLCGVMQVWFSAKLGLKISDGSQQWAQFLWPPTAPATQQTGTNYFYSSIWIQQTALYGQGRVSLALWGHAGLIFSKTWVENQWWIPAVNKISVTTNSPSDTTNRNQPLLFFHMDPTNTIVWTRKGFIGSVVSGRSDFQQNLGWKSVIWIPAVNKISVTTNSPSNTTNRNQPLLFFHMDPYIIN
jgi:hypothetical protein